MAEEFQPHDRLEEHVGQLVPLEQPLARESEVGDLESRLVPIRPVQVVERAREEPQRRGRPATAELVVDEEDRGLAGHLRGGSPGQAGAVRECVRQERMVLAAQALRLVGVDHLLDLVVVETVAGSLRSHHPGPPLHLGEVLEHGHPPPLEDPCDEVRVEIDNDKEEG